MCFSRWFNKNVDQVGQFLRKKVNRNIQKLFDDLAFGSVGYLVMEDFISIFLNRILYIWGFSKF